MEEMRDIREDKGIVKALDKSPINYFSDLYMIAIVVIWILGTILMTGMAIYTTVVMDEVYMWDYVSTLITVPLTGSGIAWLLKCGAQHYVANSNGEQAHMDFPDEELVNTDDPDMINVEDDYDNDSIELDVDDE